MVALQSILGRYKTWKCLHCFLITIVTLLLLSTLTAFLLPVNAHVTISAAPLSVSPTNGNKLTNSVLPPSSSTSLRIPVRAGLFKSAAPLRRTSTSDSFVSQILGRLNLKYIMLIDNQPVAFVKIEKEKGIQRCRVGDNKGIFIVREIYLEQQYMDIEIAGQKVTLNK